MRGRSFDVLLRCFAGSVGANAATLFAMEAPGDVHVASNWARDRSQSSTPGMGRELVDRAFLADRPVVQSAIQGDDHGHSAVAAAFSSDERLLGALHATFEPPSSRPHAELVWAADSYGRLAALCMSRNPNLATVLGSARTDAVTGCLSQEGALEALDAEVERSRRQGHRLSCCMIEIDGLEEITTTQGHIEGDRVLAAVGGALRNTSRRYDAVGRISLDEFVVVMPETGGSGRRSAAERFRASLRSAAAEATSAPIDASVGVAEWDGESSPADLIEAAGGAMQQAREDADRRVQAEPVPDQGAESLAELTKDLARPLGGDAGRFSPRLGTRRRNRRD